MQDFGLLSKVSLKFMSNTKNWSFKTDKTDSRVSPSFKSPEPKGKFDLEKVKAFLAQKPIYLFGYFLLAMMIGWIFLNIFVLQEVV